jgi:hypothetical protein
MSPIKCAATLGVCVSMALGASAATAKTATFHFFSKAVYSRMSDANGKALPSNSTPAVGDRISFGDDDYVGNHKHHAKRATASDHLDCTVISATKGLCDGTIAIGGSLIIADDYVLDFTSNKPAVFKITGGTGAYRHAHGTVTATSAGNNEDLTVRVTA